MALVQLGKRGRLENEKSYCRWPRYAYSNEDDTLVLEAERLTHRADAAFQVIRGKQSVTVFVAFEQGGVEVQTQVDRERTPLRWVAGDPDLMRELFRIARKTFPSDPVLERRARLKYLGGAGE